MNIKISKLLRNISFPIFLILIFLVILIGVEKGFGGEIRGSSTSTAAWWKIQSIDTVKYSRDVARQEVNDPSFDSVIDNQVKLIAGTGANYVSIGTPYDDEFIPFLKKWVAAARKYHLNVWFRGNMSGWEGWFNYPSITPAAHTEAITKFITQNPTLFQDGDIFTSCPECENGGPGDPRKTGDVQGYRDFLISENQAGIQAFQKINKKVYTNYYPMNGDVAKLIMNKATTQSLGGVVTIDHYVATPEKLISDIRSLANQSGGEIVLGEVGVPIPDINGDLTEASQADWMSRALNMLVSEQEVVGINYWTSFGASTALWNDDASPRKVEETLKKYYSPEAFSGTIQNEIGENITGVNIKTSEGSTFTNSKGQFIVPILAPEKLQVSKVDYFDTTIDTSLVPSGSITKIKLVNETFFYKVKKFFYQLFQKRDN